MTINLDPLFYPKSIAVIGASPNVIRDRAGFFNSLRECYKGKLFAVNPKHTEIHGIRCYPSILDIPEKIDYAMILLPRDKVKDALAECVTALVSFVLVFSSGFSEIGDEEKEKELTSVLEKGNTRMIGPNCIGVTCSESGVVYYPQLLQKPGGTVGYFSQSGGHALNFLIRGISSGLEFNKVVSLGNQTDLTIEDFLEYFIGDDRIKVICGYVEDIKNGERFKNLARKTVAEYKKPLVLWKGGRSLDGARATQSHTGALAIPTAIWDAAMKQLGVINAESQEEMADILLALKCGMRPMGKKVAIVVAGGGSSVELTDAASFGDLSVPILSDAVQEKIARDISNVNTSTKNPVDLGMFGFAPSIFVNTAKLAAEDPNVDVVLVCQYPEMIKVMVKELWDISISTIVDGLKEVKKPVIVILPKIFQNNPAMEAVRAEFIGKLNEKGIVSYSSAERAARVISKLIDYYRFLENHKETDVENQFFKTKSAR